MKIDKMPAGREMDKAISQYVFGNKKFICRNCDDDYHAVSEQGGLVAYIYVPHYSTDIEAAMEVACFLRDKGASHVQLNIFPDLFGCIVWKDDIRLMASNHGESLPLSICRAALEAMGVEEC